MVNIATGQKKIPSKGVEMNSKGGYDKTDFISFVLGDLITSKRIVLREIKTKRKITNGLHHKDYLKALS